MDKVDRLKDKLKEFWGEKQYRYSVIGIAILLTICILQFSGVL